MEPSRIQDRHDRPPDDDRQPPPVASSPPPALLNCPVCGAPLAPGYRWGCRIDICGEHGIWLNKDGASRRTGWLRRAHVPFAVLCVLQVLGISGAVIAAAVDIESIVVTGPVFTVLGILVALGSLASRSPYNAVFGLSAGAMSLACLVWIASLSWSPSDAQQPVTTALLCYETLIVPIGLLALRRTVLPPVAAAISVARSWQFGIRHLLTTTSLVAVMLAVGRLGYEHGDDVRLGIAVGLAAGSVIGLGLALFVGSPNRRAAVTSFTGRS